MLYVGCVTGTMSVKYIGCVTGTMSVRYIGCVTGTMSVRYVGCVTGTMSVRYVGCVTGTMSVRYVGCVTGTMSVRYVGCVTGMMGDLRMWVRPACTLYICTYSIQIYKEKLKTVVRKLLAFTPSNRHENFTALCNTYRRVSSTGRRAQKRFSRGARGEKPENDRPPFWFYGESIRTSVHGSHIVIV